MSRGERPRRKRPTATGSHGLPGPHLGHSVALRGGTLHAMRRVVALAGLVVGIAGCGLIPIAPERMPAPDEVPVPGELEEPPPVAINGVAGRPVSWCWGGGCADGFVNSPDILPAVNPPFDIQLPPGSRIEGVEAVGPAAAGGQRINVPYEGTEIGEVPDGAMMLSVFIRFDEGGDASYYWALNRPAGWATRAVWGGLRGSNP